MKIFVQPTEKWYLLLELLLRVEMNRLIGPATLTYEDGTVIDGEARLTSIEPAGKGFIGSFQARQNFPAAQLGQEPLLDIDGVCFRVAVVRANLHGLATIETSGPPVRQARAV
jgi:hypothetical protein